MSIFREIPPTAGWPLQAKDLLTALENKKNSRSLNDDFKNYLGCSYAKVVYSGTAAFYIILESLKKISAKKTVVIPAFACPLIPLAIKKADLKIQICDINPANFGFDLNQLKTICAENTDILAILSVHLAGLPIDLDPIMEIAKLNQAFVIEDCAQSLGAEYKNKKTGSIGDFAFFSLCRGKGLTIYEGGVIIGKDAKYSKYLDQTVEEIVKRDNLSESLKIAELFAYWIFYRPQLFWLAFIGHQLYWQACKNPLRAWGEYFTTNFPTHKISEFRKRSAQINLPKLPLMLEAQRQKTEFYLNNLNNIPGLTCIRELPNTKASYPYLTLLFDTKTLREQAFKALQKLGLGISQIYLFAITDYTYLKGIVPAGNYPNARGIAAREITLSTSIFLKPADLNLIIRTIKKATGNQ